MEKTIGNKYIKILSEIRNFFYEGGSTVDYYYYY